MRDFDDYLNSVFEFHKELFKLFDRDSPIVIFDIGACEGEDSIKYSRIFPNAKIFAFEPLPGNVEKIKSNIVKYDAQAILICEKALSDKTGISSFYISSGTPEGIESNSEWDYGNKSSSLLSPDKVIEEFQWLKFDEVINVHTDTISNFCDENNIKHLDFIHLDVQGAELLVLEGAGNYLFKVKAIWLEVENISLYSNQPLKNDVESFMEKQGFFKTIDSVDKISGDQFYVNRRFTEEKTNWKIYLTNKLHLIKRTFKIFNKKYKKTYSQSGEDIIIEYIFNQLNIHYPSYIDIGAHHPFYLNNTALFYAKGCRGINVEPDPSLFKLFPLHRKHDINIQAGLGKDNGELILNIMNVPTLNTFSAAEAEILVKSHSFKILERKTVPIYNITTILGKHNQGIFPDLLTIDVEGMDEEIIASINFKESKPIVICIETISYSSAGQGVKNNSISNYLTEAGYFLYADTYINSIFVLKEQWLKR